MPGAHLSRRAFLAATVGGVMAACSSDASTGPGAGTTTRSSGPFVTAPAADLPGPVFTLGVASGDPLPDRVVLWTRLVADPAVVGGGMGDEDVPVVWDLARDREFTDMVASEEATAPAEFAHSVHVDAGGLEPDSIYWYRFRVGDQIGPVGRTQTLPDGSPTRFDLALTSCQDFQFGEYGAWRQLAGLDDLNLVLFMGDYVYEEAAFDTSPDGDRRRIWETGPPATLDDFRLRFGQTKADPSLQFAHRAAPWILMADDHEVTDNYWREGPGQFDPAILFR